MEREGRQAGAIAAGGTATAQRRDESLSGASFDGAAQTMIERVHFAELKTPDVPSFITASSEVSAIPFELARSVVGELYIRRRHSAAFPPSCAGWLSTPTALRSAILLREILGPPRSLQTAYSTGSLPPL